MPLMERGDLSALTRYDVRAGQAQTHAHARTHAQAHTGTAAVQSYSSRKCDESSLAFHAPVDTMQGSMFSLGANEEPYFSQALSSS